DDTATLRKSYFRIMQWSQDARLLSCTVFLQKLIQETGLISAVVAAPNSLERFHSIQIFFDHVTAMARSIRNFRLADFIARLDMTEEHGILTRRNYNEHMKGVRLMTAHRAKGLEFNHVFILHAVD